MPACAWPRWSLGGYPGEISGLARIGWRLVPTMPVATHSWLDSSSSGADNGCWLYRIRGKPVKFEPDATEQQRISPGGTARFPFRLTELDDAEAVEVSLKAIDGRLDPSWLRIVLSVGSQTAKPGVLEVHAPSGARIPPGTYKIVLAAHGGVAAGASVERTFEVDVRRPCVFMPEAPKFNVDASGTVTVSIKLSSCCDFEFSVPIELRRRGGSAALTSIDVTLGAGPVEIDLPIRLGNGRPNLSSSDVDVQVCADGEPIRIGDPRFWARFNQRDPPFLLRVAGLAVVLIAAAAVGAATLPARSVSRLTTTTTTPTRTAPVVTEQPNDETVTAGGPARFSANSSGSPTPTVQWQVSTDQGHSWVDLLNGPQPDRATVSGATTDTLTISATSTDESTYRFRAVFSNSLGQTDSNGATLTVNQQPSLPVVTEQPNDETVTAGGPASFTSSSSGGPTPTVQWQLSTDGGTSWSDLANGQLDGSAVSGATTDTLTISTTSTEESTYQFRAVFSNSLGQTDSNGRRSP